MIPEGWITALAVAGFLLFDAVIVAIVIYLAYRSRQAMITAWEQLGYRAGLTLDKGGLWKPAKLSGEYHRRPLTLTTYTTSSGKSSTTWTLVAVGVRNPMNEFLRLNKQGTLHALGEALGIKDITIGVADFDNFFTIKSQPPEFAFNLFAGDDMLRHDLMKIDPHTIQLKGSELRYVVVGVVRDTDRLETIFTAMSNLADQIDSKTR